MATWHCVPCKRFIQHMGVARHRQMHRERGDGPFEMHSETHIYTYDYSTTNREVGSGPGNPLASED